MMQNNPLTDDNVLTIQTVQIAPFRTFITALKDILIETNITFQPNGMRIINMDKSHRILVYSFLDKFEFYNCTKEKIIIGVNMMHLFKLITSVDNNDTLTIYIEKSDYDSGFVSHLTLKFENGNIGQCITYKLKLIEPEPEELEYPTVTFSSIINLPASDFQKIIRDLLNISEKVEIKSVGNELIFNCRGPFANAEIRRSETDNDSMSYKQKPDLCKIIQGEFSLNHLSYFIKCTSMCPQIELHFENDLPLVIKYEVAGLGEVRMCLSTIPS